MKNNSIEGLKYKIEKISKKVEQKEKNNREKKKIRKLEDQSKRYSPQMMAVQERIERKT